MARMSFLLLNACVTWRCHSVKRIWLSFRIGITQALINWLRKSNCRIGSIHISCVTLKSPNAVFLSNLAAPPASILSAEYAAQLLKSGAPSDMNRRPVGTGPFIFEKYVKDESIRYVGNPEYWKPEDVKLSKLVFSIIPEAAVRVQKLKSNECQISVYPRLVDIAALQSDPNIEVLSKPAFGMSYVAYTVTHTPLD